MKVLHIGEYVQGGVATYIRTLLLHDGEQGVENYLVLSREKSDHDWPISPEHVRYYEYHRGMRTVLPAMRAIRQAISDWQPDVIYCHSTWAGVLGRVPLFFRTSRPRVIYNAHGWSFLQDCADWKKKIYAAIERILLHVTDQVINVSRYEYQASLRYHLKSEKQCVIYSGISAKKNTIKESLYLPEENINLLFVGRFDPQKGIDMLLEAMKKLTRQDVHLYVIGDNVVSNGMGIEKKDTRNVTFLGWVSNNQVGRWYEACDAVIMPSRWEAFGLVAIEAMKYGKPVFVNNCGALPELIKDNETGKVIDIDSTDKLEKIIMSLRKEDLQRISNKSLSVFKHKYTDFKMMKSTYNIYRKICLKVKL